MARGVGRGLLPGLMALLAITASGCETTGGPAAPTPLPCAYTLSADSQAFPAHGGAGSVAIASDAGCAWSVDGANEWVSVTSPTSGAGPAVVSFSVSPNPGAVARERSMTIATRPFRITQEGQSACTFTVVPERLEIGAAGGARTISVDTASGCQWSAASGSAWIAAAPGSGVGPGTVTVQVAEHNATSPRTGTVRVAGQAITVDQAGEAPQPLDCRYTVSPVEFQLHWHGAYTGNSSVRVATAGGCTWTVASAASWIRVESGTSGTGSGTIALDVGDYVGEVTRRGSVRVRWPTPTQGQNVWVTQEGCRFALERTAFTMPSAGGTDRALVFGGPVTPACSLGCPWTAISNAAWLRVVGGSPGSGDNPVTYEATANTTGVQRTGIIRVETATLTVTQPPL